MFNRKMYVGHLKAVPLFSACSVKQLEELARHTETVTVSAGSPVVKEGSVGREFFVISAGRARVSRRGRKLAILGPGDFFGEVRAAKRRLPQNIFKKQQIRDGWDLNVKM
jgi:CRP-like cAMP-binding protein